MVGRRQTITEYASVHSQQYRRAGHTSRQSWNSPCSAATPLGYPGGHGRIAGMVAGRACHICASIQASVQLSALDGLQAGRGYIGRRLSWAPPVRYLVVSIAKNATRRRLKPGAFCTACPLPRTMARSACSVPASASAMASIGGNQSPESTSAGRCRPARRSSGSQTSQGTARASSHIHSCKIPGQPAQ